MVVDGDEMGGKDVRVGFGSNASNYTVGKNGRREGSGGDVEKMVHSKCQISLSWYLDF